MFHMWGFFCLLGPGSFLWSFFSFPEANTFVPQVFFYLFVHSLTTILVALAFVSPYIYTIIIHLYTETVIVIL